MSEEDKVLMEFLGKELFEELLNQINTSADDDRNFLLELKKAFVTDIKSIDLI